MGRKKKIEMGYFPMDVDFFNDIKIRKLIRRKGSDGITLYTYILCLVYKNGYYLEWDDDMPFIASEATRISETTISEILSYCMDIDLFSREMFEQHHVLTSEGVQIRYKKMNEKMKRKADMEEFNLISSEEMQKNDPDKDISSEEMQKTVQNRGGKEKEKEKEKENISLSLSPSLRSVDKKESKSAYQPTERERVFRSFFLRNFRDPTKETERFYNHYEAGGWTRNGGVKVADRLALAATWQPKSDAEIGRFPPPFCDFWRDCYDALSRIEAARPYLPLMFSCLFAVSEHEKELKLCCTEHLYNFIEWAANWIMPYFRKYYPDKEKTTYELRTQKL